MEQRRPSSDEHAPAYARYIERVQENDIVEVLTVQQVEMGEFFADIPRDLAEHRYAPDKWSIKELIGHVADAERVFMYRALVFARGDTAELPGFEEGEYVAGAHSSRLALDAVVRDAWDVRSSTLSLLRNLPEEAWDRSGVASGFRVSVRALAYIVAGHMRHHAAILRERYL